MTAIPLEKELRLILADVPQRSDGVSELPASGSGSAEDIEAVCEAAADRLNAYRLELENVVKAWNSLPGSHVYSAKIIEQWLVDTMTPAIQRLRVLQEAVRVNDSLPR